MPEFQAQPQDLVVTLLGSYLPVRETPVWSGGLVRALGEFGFSVAASRVALSRLVVRGLLTREREGRLIHYRITERCRMVLQEGDERIFSLGRRPRPYERWTVLWHSIPDDRRLERGRLARRLRFLGFGSVQDGTWIAPRDREREVAALLRDLGVAAHAGLMVGRPADSLDFAGVARRAWDFEELDNRYRGFVDEFARYARDGAPASLSRRKAFLLRTRLVHRFREFPQLDPELPGEVLPPPQHRRQAVSVFHRLYRTLRAPAQQHFESLTAL